MSDDTKWGRLVTAEELHAAAELLNSEPPEGTPAGITQAEEIGRFLRESDFTLRLEDGTLAGEFPVDPDSLGFGVVLGLLVARADQ